MKKKSLDAVMDPDHDGNGDSGDSGDMDIHEDHQANMDLKTLMDAHHIKNHPERMGKVQQLAGRHKKAIKSIEDLKTIYDEKFGAKGSAVKGTKMGGGTLPGGD